MLAEKYYTIVNVTQNISVPIKEGDSLLFKAKQKKGGGRGGG